MIFYIQTNDPGRVVRVPSNERDGYPEIVRDNLPPGAFNLTNTLKTSAMKEARAAAKESGLRLKAVRVMAARQEVPRR